jgi:hypothetical protein
MKSCRFTKGSRILFNKQKGYLLTEPKYVATQRSGLHYADILWSDNTISKGFCLNNYEVRLCH